GGSFGGGKIAALVTQPGIRRHQVNGNRVMNAVTNPGAPQFVDDSVPAGGPDHVLVEGMSPSGGRDRQDRVGVCQQPRIEGGQTQANTERFVKMQKLDAQDG